MIAPRQALELTILKIFRGHPRRQRSPLVASRIRQVSRIYIRQLKIIIMYNSVPFDIEKRSQLGQTYRLRCP